MQQQLNNRDNRHRASGLGQEEGLIKRAQSSRTISKIRTPLTKSYCSAPSSGGRTSCGSKSSARGGHSRQQSSGSQRR